MPVPNLPGTAHATARLPRFWDGEPVPALVDGYLETEYFLYGSARTYAGPVTGPVVVVTDENPYVTRILVRHPTDPADISGRVVVEPFNTSFGMDRDALWARVGALLQAEGDAWIGVTVRAMGAAELRTFDSSRYAEIDFPVNDLAWDALRDIGALVKAGGHASPLGDVAVRRVYLGGYSQSAVDIATFALAFNATARLADSSPIYDGYFPAAHAASFAAISSGNTWVPPMEHSWMRDIDVPVIEVQPQSDVEGFPAQLDSVVFVNPGSASVRRADSDFKRGRYRLYELAGAPHATCLDGCEGPGSSFPTSAFMRAALRLLFEWVEDAVDPAAGPRISRTRRGRYRWRGSTNTEIPSGACAHPTSTFRLRIMRPIHAGTDVPTGGSETLLPTEALVARYQDATRVLDRVHGGAGRDDPRPVPPGRRPGADLA